MFSRCTSRLSPKASIESPQRPVNARRELPRTLQAGCRLGEDSVASPALSVAEERFEIAVESLQELVDLDDVVDRDRVAWLAFVLRLDARVRVRTCSSPRRRSASWASSASPSPITAATKLRAWHSPHETISIHMSDLRERTWTSSGSKPAMTDAASFHAVENYALDLLFRRIHDCRFRRRIDPQFPDLRSKSSRSRLSMKSRKTESLSSSTPSARSSSG